MSSSSQHESALLRSEENEQTASSRKEGTNSVRTKKRNLHSLLQPRSPEEHSSTVNKKNKLALQFGKTLRGLMSLDVFLWMVRSEFHINDMKSWIHPALSQQFGLLVV